MAALSAAANNRQNYPMRNEPEDMARFQCGTSLDG
jgi:hypothetical protein